MLPVVKRVTNPYALDYLVAIGVIDVGFGHLRPRVTPRIDRASKAE